VAGKAPAAAIRASWPHGLPPRRAGVAAAARPMPAAARLGRRAWARRKLLAGALSRRLAAPPVSGPVGGE